MMPVATILKMPYLVRMAIFTAVATTVVVGFLAIRVIVNHEELDQSQSLVTSEGGLNVKDLEAQYLLSVQEILVAYAGSVRADEPNLNALTVQAQNQLLALKVPASQRDAHLALVLDFDAVKIAIADNSPDSIATALSTITAQVKAN